jgi:hypothetical protein
LRFTYLVFVLAALVATGATLLGGESFVGNTAADAQVVATGPEHHHPEHHHHHNGGAGHGGAGPVIQDPTQTFVSGSNTNTGGAVNSTGDNSNTCAAQENFNNSGGVLNQQQAQQYASDSGGIEFLGSSFTNAPDQSVPCTPSVQQSAAASSNP